MGGRSDDRPSTRFAFYGRWVHHHERATARCSPLRMWVSRSLKNRVIPSPIYSSNAREVRIRELGRVAGRSLARFPMRPTEDESGVTFAGQDASESGVSPLGTTALEGLAGATCMAHNFHRPLPFSGAAHERNSGTSGPSRSIWTSNSRTTARRPARLIRSLADVERIALACSPWRGQST
jgi:hypothetical protein